VRTRIDFTRREVSFEECFDESSSMNSFTSSERTERSDSRTAPVATISSGLFPSKTSEMYFAIVSRFTRRPKPRP
jgi:hypothetical protein